MSPTKLACLFAVPFMALAMSSYFQIAIAADPPAGQQARQSADKVAQAEMKIADALAKLPAEDRKLAESQRFCAVLERNRLGVMGTPVKVMIEGKPVLLCCKGCVAEATKSGKQTLQKAEKLKKVSAELAKLSPADRASAESQKYCAIAEGSLLGGMGAPVKLVLDGKPVFLCCQGCTRKAQANPAATLAKVDELRKAGAAH